MSRNRLPSWFDAWLTNNPDEQDDAPECVKCSELMEWEDDHDEFGPCGNWKCKCENEQPPKQKNGSDCEGSK